MLPDKPTDRSVTRNGITYTQNTANIGKRPKSAISAAGLRVRWTFTPSLAKRVKHDGTQEDGANDGRDPHHFDVVKLSMSRHPPLYAPRIPRLPAQTARLDACRRAASGGGTARVSSQHRADQCNREIMARIIRYAEIAEPGIVRRSWNYFGRRELNEGHRASRSATMHLHTYRDESRSRHLDLTGGGRHRWSIDLVSATASGILVLGFACAFVALWVH